jgi:hypothetical protein
LRNGGRRNNYEELFSHPLQTQDCCALKGKEYSITAKNGNRAGFDGEHFHLTEMNHSKKFWAIVANVLPDYKERQKRLQELQRRLAGED